MINERLQKRMEDYLKPKLYEVVDIVYDNVMNQIKSKYNIDHFLIDAKDIKKCIFFGLMVLDKQKNAKTISIISYCKDTYKDGKFKHYSDKDAMADQYFHAYYYMILDHFSKFNYQNVLNKKVKKKDIKTNLEGYMVYDYQLHEFAVLEEAFGDITYKRLRSNNLHKLKFDEYECLVKKLKNKILNSNLAFKNIQLYKLEKRFNLELLKSILKATMSIKKTSLKNGINDLITVAKIAEIDTRQKYVEIYPDLSYKEKESWRAEVLLLSAMLPEMLERALIVANEINSGEANHYNLCQYDKDWFRSIYSDEKYVNNYVYKKDFSVSKFLFYTEQIEKINKTNIDTIESLIVND